MKITSKNAIKMAVAAVLSVCATAPGLAQSHMSHAQAPALETTALQSDPYSAYAMVTTGDKVVGQDPDEFIRLQLLKEQPNIYNR